MHAELAHHARLVDFHSAHADAQLSGNIPVVFATYDSLHNFFFPLSQMSHAFDKLSFTPISIFPLFLTGQRLFY